MPKATVVKTIIITPDGTHLDDLTVKPESISLVLDDGQMFSIEELAQIVRKKTKVKREGRMRKGLRAFKTAYKEAAEHDSEQG